MIKTGIVIFHPFGLILGWIFIEMGFLISIIWKPSKISYSKSQKSNVRKISTLRLNFFSKSYLLIYSGRIIYNLIITLCNSALLEGILLPYLGIFIILFVYSLSINIYLFFSVGDRKVMIFMIIIIIYEIICYIWIIPHQPSYFAVLWLYVPLLSGIFDILQFFFLHLSMNDSKLSNSIKYTKF